MYTIPLPVDWPFQSIIPFENPNMLNAIFQTSMAPVYVMASFCPTITEPMFQAPLTNPYFMQMPMNAPQLLSVSNQPLTSEKERLPFGIDVILGKLEAEKQTPPSPPTSTPSVSFSSTSSPSTSTLTSSSPSITPKTAVKFTEEITDFLVTWFNEHIKNPYVNKTDVEMIKTRTHLTKEQIHGWFTNQRRRYELKNPGTLPWVKRPAPACARIKRAKAGDNNADEPTKKRARRCKAL